MIARSTKIIALSTLVLMPLLMIFTSKSENTKTLIVGYPRFWGSLIPPLQHTVYADAILGNQFEPLVDMESGGIIVPLAAKSWTINENFTVYTFQIETSRKFSNGTPLTASSFKKAWEHGLSLSPKSSNSSLADVLYAVKGYEDFSESGTLSGVIAKSDAVLEVHFKKPFRIALDHFTGNRFAAFIVENGRYLGTGPYYIDNENETHLKLYRNPYSSFQTGFSEIYIKTVEPMNALKEFNDDNLDIYAFAGRSYVDVDCRTNSFSLACVQGFESSHLILSLNGAKGRFFSNEKFRLAMQYLFYENAQSKIWSSVSAKAMDTIKPDPQVYLPLQSGRLSNEEAREIILRGKDFVPELVETLKSNPLKFVYTDGSPIGEQIMHFLVEQGISLTSDSGPLIFSSIVEIYYKSFDTDFLLASKSIVNGDPDGLYHALGKNGAIASPLEQRPFVAELLEKGRDLLDRVEVDAHYKKVSKAVLEEVPFIHLGFMGENTVYRTDKVRIDMTSIRSRMREPLADFLPAE